MNHADEDHTPIVVLEIFDENGNPYDLREAPLIDVHDEADGDGLDSYAQFAGELGDGKGFNIRVFLDDFPRMLEMRLVSTETVYPHKAKLKGELDEVLKLGPDHVFTAREIAQFMVEVLGEYEHGSADVETVNRVNLDQYAGVLCDAFIGLMSSKQLRCAGEETAE